MDFWASLTVEVLGGLATAVFLGLVVAWRDARQGVERHNRQVQALEEDLNRFLEDRDRLLRAEQEEAARAREASGRTLTPVSKIKIEAECCQQALGDYSIQMTRAKRAYEDIKNAEGSFLLLVRGRPRKRLVLSDENHKRLARWRADKVTGAMRYEVDDPSSGHVRVFEEETRR